MKITRGSNTSLKSTTLEARLFEGFYLLTTKIADIAEVTVNWDINIPNAQASISYQLPAAHASGTDGAVNIKGVDVVADAEFKPGDGQFASTHLIGQLVEMIYLGQNAEIAQSTTESINMITANYDSDEQYVSGNVTIPLEIETNDSNGSLSFVAKEFLN